GSSTWGSCSVATTRRPSQGDDATSYLFLIIARTLRRPECRQRLGGLTGAAPNTVAIRSRCANGETDQPGFGATSRQKGGPSGLSPAPQHAAAFRHDERPRAARRGCAWSLGIAVVRDLVHEAVLGLVRRRQLVEP